MTERSAQRTYDTLLAGRLRQAREAVEQEMRAVLSAPDDSPDLVTMSPGRPVTLSLFGMLHYHMGWVDENGKPVVGNGGKRIRPVLCLLSCMAAGGEWKRAVPAAAAVELLHNFSLIHDDIEDDSPIRHGRPTVWQLWGVPLAINTGDALFAFAHLALHRLSDQGIAPGIVVQALRRFDEACIALTQGQHTDMAFEGRKEVSADEYIEMIGGKTATLLALSAELGALVAGTDRPTVEHYAAFGRELGLAFQVRDDILGIWGDEALIGKSAATDIETRKKTLPVLYGLEQSPRLQALYARSENGSDFVGHVVEELERVGARAYAEELEASYMDSALGHLEAAEPVDPGYSALRQLALQLLGREA